MRTRFIYKSPVAACVENIFSVFAVIKFNIKGINNPKKSAIHKNIPSIEICFSTVPDKTSVFKFRMAKTF